MYSTQVAREWYVLLPLCWHMAGCTWTRLLHWWWHPLSCWAALFHTLNALKCPACCSVQCTQCTLFESHCTILFCSTVHWTPWSSCGYRQWSRKDQGQWWHVLLSNSLFVAQKNPVTMLTSGGCCVSFFWEWSILSLVTQRWLIGCIYKVMEEVGNHQTSSDSFCFSSLVGPIIINVGWAHYYQR